jgi:pimeloyl-ACP methyl ester carboxylesterase
VIDEPAQAPQWQTNPEERAAWLRAAGFRLVRATSRWSFDGPAPPATARLAFRSFQQVGETAFVEAIPADVTAAAMGGGARAPSARLLNDPWPLSQWPAVPTRVLQGRDDRFFPRGFQRRVVRERLGVQIDETAGGHLLALSQTTELARRLDAYWREQRSLPATGPAAHSAPPA